jgi:cytochrome c peroxidase
MKKILLPLFILLFLFVTGCQDKPTAESSLDEQLGGIISANGLTGDPSLGRDLPEITDPIAQLGMNLFYTQALSGTGDSACVSCHHPLLGGGDAIPLSIGVDADQPELLGPGRTHPEGPLVPRNAPTTFNSGIWDQVMFWDGRIESLGKTPLRNGDDGYGIHTPDRMFRYPDLDAGANLVEAQSRFPTTSEDEMRGFDFGMDTGNGLEVRDDRSRELLAAILGNYGDGAGVLEQNDWLAHFQAAFNSDASAEELITYQTIAHAIGEYERSQVFVETPWKAYVEGDVAAISESAKRGALLFFTSSANGGANCSSCHTGDFFTDEQFHVLAVPQFGPGRDSGTYGDDDWGRFLETGEPADKYAFRTPTLLNVEVTGPYGHDGAYQTLEEIVRHHLNAAEMAAAYDYSQLDSSIRTTSAAGYTQNAVEQLQANRAAGIVTVMDLDLTDEQVADLVNFLLTLTDPCVKDPACLAPWIPDESLPDPDGMRLIAVDAEGNRLN